MRFNLIQYWKRIKIHKSILKRIQLQIHILLEYVHVKIRWIPSDFRKSIQIINLFAWFCSNI